MLCGAGTADYGRLPGSSGNKILPRLRHVDDFNYAKGGWAALHERLFEDAEDPLKLIDGRDAREAGDNLRERLLQDRAATSVVTALLLTISFAMLCLDPSSINHAVVFNPEDRKGIPYFSFDATVDVGENVTSSAAKLEHAGSEWSVGLVRLTYVLLNVVSTMLSLISIYGGTWEYLLINKCPANHMIFLVQYLHNEKRSGLSKMFEPWKATVGAAITLMLSMVVLVFALYGVWIWAATVFVVVAMSVAAWKAFDHLKPDLVFEAVHNLHEKEKEG